MTENLINRISFYLASGGLFNPELADHIAVRTLLFECREALAQRTWVGLTFDERLELADDVDWPAGAYCEYAEKIEIKLKEKNEFC
jgi:hypothetical protein